MVRENRDMLDQLKERRNELEDYFLRFIQQFEDEFGVTVWDIDVGRICTGMACDKNPGRTEVESVRLEVKL